MLPRLLAFLLLLSALLSAAQTPPSSHTLQIPPAAQAGPGFDREAATRAYLATLGPEQKTRSDGYFEGGSWLILWDFLYGAAVSVLLLWTRFSARMRDLAERIAPRNPLATWLYWAQYSIALFVLGFPLAVYEGFVREHQYGLSNQTFAAWLIDECKGLGLNILLGGLVVMALFGIVRRLSRTWHVWGACVAILFQMILILISPVFIAPMFNKYTPLTDARIRDPILRIARQNGISATTVYQVDASRQSKRISANVSGFLGTERITLNDNLLNRCSPQAVLAVMGHEMGHLRSEPSIQVSNLLCDRGCGFLRGAAMGSGLVARSLGRAMADPRHGRSGRGTASSTDTVGPLLRLHADQQHVGPHAGIRGRYFRTQQCATARRRRGGGATTR